MNNKSIHEFEYVTCALCNSDTTELFFEDRCFHLVRCKKCGLVYINPRPTQEELNRMYNLSVQTDKGVIDHTGYMELAYLHVLKAKKFLSIIKKYKKKGRILDIGCASGFFLNLAKQQGFDPYGVEISESFCSFAKKEFNLDIFCGTLKERNYPREYFDVVTMFDVLSHLPTPVEELNEANRVLRKGGLLLIETGNKGELNAKAVEKWGSVWGSPSHLYHFSPKTLMKLLDMTGFDCINIDKSPIILSSTMEASLKRLIRSGKSKDVSYQQLQVSATPLVIKRGLMKAGAHLYFFTKYNLGKLLPKSNVDCTMIVCSKKRRDTRPERARRLIDDKESCPVLHLGSYEYPSRADKLQLLFETYLSESCIVLDAGCGPKQRYISNLHPDAWGVGLDIDRENVAKSKKANTPKNVSFIVGDLRNLPFIDNTFDTVVCYDVLEHVKEPDKAIKELALVLKERGSLLISTSNLFNPAFLIDMLLPNIISDKIIQKLGGPAYYERTYRFDPWNLVKKLRKCGLSVKISMFGYPPVWNPWFYEYSRQKPPKIGYLWIGLDKLTNIKLLKKFKEIMIAIAEK